MGDRARAGGLCGGLEERIDRPQGAIASRPFERGLARRGGAQTEAHGLLGPGREVQGDPQAHDGIEHRADRPRERCALQEGTGAGYVPTPTDEAHAIGLVLDGACFEVLEREPVDEPQGFLASAAGTPPRHQGPLPGHLLGFYEELGEGRVCGILRLRREHHLGIARDLDAPRDRSVVLDRAAAQLQILVRCDPDRKARLDPLVDAFDLE